MLRAKTCFSRIAATLEAIFAPPYLFRPAATVHWGVQQRIVRILMAVQFRQCTSSACLIITRRMSIAGNSM